MDTIKMTSTRCRRCGRVLEPSELPDYTWQCRDCDEDFYSFEAIQFTVQIEPVSSVTIKDFEEYNFNIDWSKRRKIIVTDGKHIGYVLETIDEIQKLGLEYIADHAMLLYDRILDDYAVTISRNDYYNDTERNPVKVIPVRFVEIAESKATATISARSQAPRTSPSGTSAERAVCRTTETSRDRT